MVTACLQEKNKQIGKKSFTEQSQENSWGAGENGKGHRKLNISEFLVLGLSRFSKESDKDMQQL